MLLRQPLVSRLTGFDSSGRGWRRGGRQDSFPLNVSESEVSVSGSLSAHTCPDRRAAVLAQVPLLLQCPGYLLPVEFGVGGVPGTEGRLGDVFTAEAAVPLPACDPEDEDVLARGRPGALRLVLGDQLPLDGLRGDRFGLAADLHPRPVLVLSSVHPSSPSSPATLLTAAQHQLMGNTSQHQQDGEIGEESHGTCGKDPARGYISDLDI